MENMLNKFGGYDFWVTLFPGIVCVWGGCNFYHIIIRVLSAENSMQTVEGTVSLLKVYCPDNIYVLFGMIVFSYLVGLIINELGGTLKKIIYRKGKPTECLLDSQEKVLNNYEVEEMKKIIATIGYESKLLEDANDTKELSKSLFNHMNYSLQMKDKASRFSKLSQISNMCISLAVIFILFLLAGCCCIIIEAKKALFIWMKLTLFFEALLFIGCVVLIAKGKKFNRYWVRAIIYAYEKQNRKSK